MRRSREISFVENCTKADVGVYAALGPLFKLKGNFDLDGCRIAETQSLVDR